MFTLEFCEPLNGHRGCQASDLGKALAQAQVHSRFRIFRFFFFVPDTKSGSPSCMGGAGELRPC